MNVDLGREIAAEQVWLAVRKIQLLLLKQALVEEKYDPSQPRVPAGNSEGGQWTYVAGYAQGRSAARQDFDAFLRGRTRAQGIEDIRRTREGEVVEAQFVRGARKYTPLLEEEELNGGHTLKEHVFRKEEEILALVRKDKYEGLFVIAFRWQGEGIFLSRESANDFVNRVLEENRETVDLVASGQLAEAFMSKRFGYRTGREAYRAAIATEPYMRDTYEVGVKIKHNPNRGRGYTVITAYPMNRNR